MSPEKYLWYLWWLLFGWLPIRTKNRVQEWLHRLEQSVARSFAALLREVPMGWKLGD